MLLRRVSKHVKEQNWFAVALDFFIVVVGILIAFQITNWSEARNEIQDRLNIESRLLNDFTLLLSEANGAIGFSEDTIKGLYAVQRAIETGAIPDDAKQVFETGLFRGQAGPSLAFRSSTYVEIQSSGRLDLIKNEEARIVLGRVDGNSVARSINHSQIYDMMDRAGVGQSFIKHRDLEALWRDEAGNLALGPINSYDLEAMITDEKMHGTVKYAVELQTWAHSELIAQKRDVETAIKTLKKSGQ